MIVWGNHSPTMYPDYRFATTDGKPLKALIDDENWNRNEFLPKVGKRGAAIIEARGLSSAASAANAAIDHVRDWILRQQRQVGHDGRPVGRQLRHSGGRRLRRAGDHRQRRVHARTRPCRSTTSRARR